MARCHRPEPKKIARAIIDNPRNPLFNASRQQLVDGLRGNLENLEATDAIEIQIRNGQGEHVLHASQLVR